MGRRLGMCIEVCLTAFAAYAQVVEGLSCSDNAYAVSPGDRYLLELWQKEAAAVAPTS